MGEGSWWMVERMRGAGLTAVVVGVSWTGESTMSFAPEGGRRGIEVGFEGSSVDEDGSCASRVAGLCGGEGGRAMLAGGGVKKDESSSREDGFEFGGEGGSWSSTDSLAITLEGSASSTIES